MRNQEADGRIPAFPGVGYVNSWYPQLEGGMYQNGTATAYALIGALEDETFSAQQVVKYGDQLRRGARYLEQIYSANSAFGSVHHTAITAYALELAAVRLNDARSRSAADSILAVMRQLTYSANKQTFWPVNRAPSTSSQILSGTISASTTEVETAAFMLSTHVIMKNRTCAEPVFAFLLSQRNAKHKLPRNSPSTHSTAVGQQAIGDHILFMKIPVTQSGSIVIESLTKGAGFYKEVVVTSSVVQPIEIPVPFGVMEVQVTSTAGATQIYFKTLKYYQNPYHAYREHHSGVVDMHVVAHPTSDGRQFATINICNQWLRNESSGMIVTHVEMQSGYSLHSTLQDIQDQHVLVGGGSLIGNVEKVDDKNFAIYYNYLPPYTDVCTEVLLRRSIVVEDLATAAVRTYSYYQSQYISFELYKTTVQSHPSKKNKHEEL